MAATNLQSLIGRLNKLRHCAPEAAAGLRASRAHCNVKSEHRRLATPSTQPGFSRSGTRRW
jgi:hypothetical protein